MGLYPTIQSPCPYKGQLTDIVDGSICRLCHREVHDLSSLREVERIALIEDCRDEICVTYKVPARSMLAALALGVTATAAPGLTQTQASHPESTSQQAVEPTAPDSSEEYLIIMVGGLRKPQQARWLSDRPASKGRELPVIHESSPPIEAESPLPRPNASPLKRT